MDKYIENYGKYTKRVRMLYVCSLLLFVFLAVFEYVCSGKILAAIGALAWGVVMFVVIRLLQKADDDFISEVVAAMSDLLDNLSELKRQQVFPENDDSLVSRLQSKVDKIIDALKLQKELDIYLHLAEAYWTQGNKRKAADVLKEAEKLWPDAAELSALKKRLKMPNAQN